MSNNGEECKHQSTIVYKDPKTQQPTSRHCLDCGAQLPL